MANYDPKDVVRVAKPVIPDETLQLMETFKVQGQEFWDEVDALGNSRELSIAKIKIEEAVMWAVKHVTA